MIFTQKPFRHAPCISPVAMHDLVSANDLSHTIDAYAAGRAIDFPGADAYGAPVARMSRRVALDPFAAFVNAIAGAPTLSFGETR